MPHLVWVRHFWYRDLFILQAVAIICHMIRPSMRADASIGPYKSFAAFIAHGKVSPRRDEGIPPYSLIVSWLSIIK